MSKTTYFDLNKPAGTDLVDVSEFNDNFDTIDTEMHRPPLTVNGVSPDSNRNVLISSVPVADNIASDESQILTGDFVIRTSGGSSSISDGTATLSSIMGNAVKTGYIPEEISLTVTPIDPTAEDAISATIDRATLVAYMATSGDVTFTYTTGWSSDPANYGITVYGTPVAGDQMFLSYTKLNRGTISIPSPVKFVSTGWNLFNYSAGYARVPRYSDTYGFIISGSYSAVEFSTSLTGTRTTIVPASGHFMVPSDGYVFVTGGNNTNTAIYATWSDWTDGTPEAFAEYTQTEIDISGVMVNFPNGLMRVGGVADEINFNTQKSISRIGRMAYSDENMETIIASGLPYDTDQNYIYYVKSDADSYDIDLEGSYSVDDHGTELFTGVTVPVYATIIYGQDLAGKLRRDVLTISAQELTDAEQAQARTNIGAAGLTDMESVNSTLTAALMVKEYSYKVASVSANSGAVLSATNFGISAIDGYTPVAVTYFTTGSNSLMVYRVAAVVSGTVASIRNITNAAVTNKTFTVRILFARNALL